MHILINLCKNNINTRLLFRFISVLQMYNDDNLSGIKNKLRKSINILISINI